MKAAVNIVRIIVGVLFIFSGLVKANDPLGLSYKMQEFFEIWGLHQFQSTTLLLSVLLNAFEIIAGFALLLGWRIKAFSWMLLLMILFFTFLTGYTYITGNPKNCGCFGDCLPITSQFSFFKDVILTILIGFIFWKQHLIKPLFKERMNTVLMLLITFFSFGFQWYTLTYLPVVDCLPFKKGNDINEKVKLPADYVPDSTVITFVYKKDGKEIEFTADKFPADFNKDTYTFIRRFDKVVRKGKNTEPAIKGFVLTGETNIDSTSYVLNQPYAVLLFCEKFSVAGTAWKKKFEEIVTVANSRNVPVYIITAEMAIAEQTKKGTGFEKVPVFKSDYKAIQTASRSDITIYLLNKGKIINKYSGKSMHKINGDIASIPVQPKTEPVIPVTDSTLNNQ